jgi:hypothetical protein
MAVKNTMLLPWFGVHIKVAGPVLAISIITLSYVGISM